MRNKELVFVTTFIMTMIIFIFILVIVGILNPVYTKIYFGEEQITQNVDILNLSLEITSPSKNHYILDLYNPNTKQIKPIMVLEEDVQLILDQEAESTSYAELTIIQKVNKTTKEIKILPIDKKQLGDILPEDSLGSIKSVIVHLTESDYNLWRQE